MSAYVVDVSFAPCRVEIWRAGKAPRFRFDQSLPMRAAGVLPVISASVADGPRTAMGGLVVSTGLDSAVRLDEALAGVPGAKADDVAPYGPRRARLRALSIAGELFENVPSGLRPHLEGAVGAVGAPMLARWRLRLDFPRGRLFLRRP